MFDNVGQVFYCVSYSTYSVNSSPTLLEGTGIEIVGNHNRQVTISADTSVLQEKLTAGTGIDITNNVISATATDSNICLIDIADIRADGVACYNTYLAAIQANKICLMSYESRNND